MLCEHCSRELQHAARCALLRWQVLLDPMCEGVFGAHCSLHPKVRDSSHSLFGAHCSLHPKVRDSSHSLFGAHCSLHLKMGRTAGPTDRLTD